MTNLILFALLIFLVIAFAQGWIVSPYLERWKSHPSKAEQEKVLGERDKALIVSFLSTHPRESVMDIRWGMKDHTLGEHDWVGKSERYLYRLLDQMEAEGIVQQDLGIIGERVFSLVAPPEKLMRAR